MLTDFRYAWRVLSKSPVFTLTAIVTIALGIAAATAIFSVTEAVLLRPLPYKDPSKLVIARSDLTKRNVKDFPFSNADFMDLKKGTEGSLEDMAAVSTDREAFLRPDETNEELSVAGVTTNLVPLLGGRIVAGRGFEPADGEPGPANPAAGAPPPTFNALISYEYWQRRFGGSRDVIGQRMRQGQGGPVIVGVVGPGLELLFPQSSDVERKPDIYIALRLRYDNADRNSVSHHLIGRLKDGASVEQVQSQADVVAAELRRNFTIKQTSGMAIVVEPMQRHLVESVRPAILALMGAVIFLLLIACANVANLLLVRASLRQREYAVRTALGGGWWHLARQALAEVFVLAAIGTSVGIGLAWVALHRLLQIAPTNLPRLDNVEINGPVVAFAACAGLLAAAIFGLAPLVRVMRPDVILVLRTDGRTAGLGGGNLLRGVLVVTEVALCFVLLIGSGLMIRSFFALQRVDPGFDSNGLHTFELDGSREIPPDKRAAFQNQLRQTLASLPGVMSVSATSRIPLAGHFSPIRWGTEEALTDPSKFKAVDAQIVLPGYFETMRTPLIEGRTFNDQDNRPKRNVVVVDQALALKAFGGASAIGKRILIRIRTPEPEWVEVIGVVQHQRDTALTEPGREQIYFADAFAGFGPARMWMVRTQADSPQLTAQVREVFTRADSNIVLVAARPMNEFVENAKSGTRFQLFLIATFAFIAALLAAIGLYGVLSTVVRQRTPELGVRIALGAAPPAVFRLVVGYGLRLSAIGVAIGIVAGLLLTRLMSTMLVDVKPADPLTFAAVAVAFLLIAAIAAWIPARRAAGLDPMGALRDA